MKTLLKLEEAAQFLGSVVLFSQLPYHWWWFPALLLLPDLSMLGYLRNPKVGAFTYNLVHHKGTGILIGLSGLLLGHSGLMLAGLILFGHAAMDRLVGYGLKFPDQFAHTHLGLIGRRVKPTDEPSSVGTNRV